jgi:transposase
MKSISNEIRTLIIEAKKRNEKGKDIAKWLKISESSVIVIWRLFRDTNSVEPKPYNGRKPSFTNEMKDKVCQIIKEQPDMTLEEIIDELDLPIKKSRLSEWLIEDGYTFKKKHFLQMSSLGKTFKQTVKNGERYRRRKPLTQKA